MKEFKRNEQGLFICEECGKKFIFKNGFSRHIKHNYGFKKYYDKWLKINTDGICTICSSPTIFDNLYVGYKKYCSKNCENIYRKQSISESRKIKGKQWIQKSKETCLKKYNVDNVFKSNDIKNKIKESCLNHFGVENPAQAEEVKQKTKNTCLKKFGVEYIFQNEDVKEKIKQTNLKKFSVEYTFQNEEIMRKSKQTRKAKYKNGWFNDETMKRTLLEMYGVDHNMKNPETFEKAQKSSLHAHVFNDTNLYYRGTYELDFLKKYYHIFNSIEKGPYIKYEYRNTDHVYYPDFFIPSLNLIVEIKSSRTIVLDGENKVLAKCLAAKKQYNFIMILDKNYNEFNKKYISLL